GAGAGPVDRAEQPVLGRGAFDRDLPGVGGWRPDEKVPASAISYRAPGRAWAARVPGRGLGARRGKPGEAPAGRVRRSVGRAGGDRAGGGTELAGRGGAGSPAAGRARPRREAGLVDELERHVPGQQLAPVEADPSSACETRAVEVIEARVEHGAPAGTRGLEGRDRVCPE